VSSSFAEYTGWETDIIVAGAAGKTKAWEIYMWSCNIDQPQDIPGAGNVGEWFQAQLAHLQGQSAFLEVGDSGFIDHLQHRAWGDATSATVVFTQYTMGGTQIRNLITEYGEAEVYVDDVLHVYHQSTAAAAQNYEFAVGYKWITLATQRLLELLQKWQ